MNQRIARLGHHFQVRARNRFGPTVRFLLQFIARLERFGLTATPLPHEARLVIDKDTRDVRAVEVRAQGR